MRTLLELVKRRRSIRQVRGGEIDPRLISDILETSDYRDFAYRFGGNLVARVFKGGQPLWPKEVD